MLSMVRRQFSTWLGWHSTPNFSLIVWAARANDPGINVVDGLFPLVASLANISINKHCIGFDHLNCSLLLSFSSSFVLSIATLTRTGSEIKIQQANTKNNVKTVFHVHLKILSSIMKCKRIIDFNEESSRKSHYIATYTKKIYSFYITL